MKLFIETLGCPKNFNDSEGIGGVWKKAGMTVTGELDQADAILVNTCGFINDAKKESIDRIFDMARFIEDKQAESGCRPLLIVTGCLSERYGSDLFDEMPEVDIFLGVNDYEKLPDIVRNLKKGERKQVFSCEPAVFEEFSARNIGDDPYSMTIRIAEGCNNCCAYCVIPQIRGRYRSRPMENIIREAEQLAERGCRELMLIAQDVTEYGRDLYGSLKLPELLRKLCRTEGIEWIRRLRDAIPDIHIRTTLITGFPGETEEDFDELVDFVETQRFERLGVFAYSREEGTVAGDMECQIDEDVKAARADAIMRRQIDISREINESKTGNTMRVIVDEKDEDGAYIGRTQYDAPEIDNTVIFRSDRELKPGDMVNVKITDAFDYDLVGRMEE